MNASDNHSPRKAEERKQKDDGKKIRFADLKSDRARATYDKILATAGTLLSEVGFEKLTTNAICARADLTPPALYRYFNDKYEILEELARRLLKRQYDAFAVWLFEGGGWGNRKQQIAKLEDWFRIAADIVADQPGGLWTMRALRALPNLAIVRLESQRMFTDQMVGYYTRLLPDVPETLLRYRLRILTEFGFVVDELAIEENEIPRDVLFREAARIIATPLSDD